MNTGTLTERRVLIDDRQQDEFDRFGFTVIDLLTPEELDIARATWEEVGASPGDPRIALHFGFHSESAEYKQTVSDHLAPATDAAIARSFHGYEPFNRMFIAKWPDHRSGIGPHQDPTLVDERRHRGVNLWMPLVDTGVTGAPDNGVLYVVPGSHRFSETVRVHDASEFMFEGSERMIIERYGVPVPLRAGQAVAFDHALIHHSMPNISSQPRIVVSCGLRPSKAAVLHVRRSSSTVVEITEVPENYFVNTNPFELQFGGPNLSPTRLVTGALPKYSPEEFEAMCAATGWTFDESSPERYERVNASPFCFLCGTEEGFDEVIEREYGNVQYLCAACSAERQARYGASGDATTAADATPESPAPEDTAEPAADLRSPGSEPPSGAKGRSLRRSVGAVAARSRRYRAAHEFLEQLPSAAAIKILAINERVIDRYGPATPAVWSTSEFDWTTRLEIAYPTIRREIDALIANPIEIPHIEDVTGGIPQGNEGPWRTLVFMHQRRWIPWNCDRCPETVALLRQIDGLSVAGLSVLEGGTHITEHRGPNKGALRYQLGLIVPGPDGTCRIRVGEDMIHWREGEGVVFDFTVPHEAWNDADTLRVLLMLEFVTPLPWRLRPLNAIAQKSMTWFPTTRDIKRRLWKLEGELVEAAANREAATRPSQNKV